MTAKEIRIMKRTQSVIALTATLTALVAVWCPRAGAAPFTDHFDTLIADMQSRAGTLSNSTDKVQQKQFKTLVKVVGTLEGKTSTSLATDAKNLGTVAKTLAKAFPGDFTPTPGTFSTDLETALQGLVGDVQAVINPVQTTLDGLGGSACAVKAQTTLTAASNLVAEASSATDFATAAKLLGSGLKSTLKAAAAAGKCTSGGGGGGGNGDFMKATISGDFSLNFSSPSAAPPTAVLTSSIDLFQIAGGDPAFSGVGISVGVAFSSVTGPGTYPVVPGSNVIRGDTGTDYTLASGTITFTTFDVANQKLAGVFNFTATQVVPAGSGTVTVTNGTFSVSKITQN
jgi:hypothetical protein